MISLELAYALRDAIEEAGRELSERERGFRCVACRRPIRPVRTSPLSDVTSEHVEPNPNCSEGIVDDRTPAAAQQQSTKKQATRR